MQWQSNRVRAEGTAQTINSHKSTNNAGYGMKSKYDISAMEVPQPLSDHPKVRQFIVS